MANLIAVPGTVVPVNSLATPGGAQGLQGLQGPQGPAGGTGGSVYTASQSVLLTGVNFTLVNDVATPSSGQYYGYSGGVRGWFTPVGTGYTGSQSVLLTGSNFTLANDVATPVTGQYYGYRNGARGWFTPDFINVLDYGADPTGAADSTTAITNAIAVMTGPATLYFPAGTYKVSSTITLNKAGTYLGDGYGSTGIRTTSATADIFNVTVQGVHIKEIQFNTSVTRTAGYYINQTLNNDFVHISDCYFLGAYNGVQLTGSSGGELRNCVFYNTVYCSIVVNGTGNTEVYIERCSCFGSTSQGINLLVERANSLFCSHCRFYTNQYAIYLNGTAGNLIDSVIINDCIIDTSTQVGIYIASTDSTGAVTNVLINGLLQATASVYAIEMVTSGTGRIDTVIIDKAKLGHNSTSNPGIYLATSAVVRVLIRDCFISGSQYGVYCQVSVSECSITGCRIFANSAYGIALGGSNTALIITNNDLRGNTSGEITGSATGSVITNNI